MKIIDLFSGLGGWSQPFIDNGHDVYRIDKDKKFKAELHVDFLEFNFSDIPWKPDIILASPPCETFSVASIGHHWHKNREPKTNAAALGKKLVLRTVEFIKFLNPKIAIIENPRGMLRKLELIDFPRKSIWYCHFGEERAKPTDLWGYQFPRTFDFRGECHNQTKSHGDDCCCRDHTPAARGSQTGTQGMKNYAIKSLIPYELANQVRIASEREVG